MNEYLIFFTKTIRVRADSPDEAEELGWASMDYTNFEIEVAQVLKGDVDDKLQ